MITPNDAIVYVYLAQRTFARIGLTFRDHRGETIMPSIVAFERYLEGRATWEIGHLNDARPATDEERRAHETPDQAF